MSFAIGHGLVIATDIAKPNLIINGDFDNWQYGTTYNSAPVGTFLADRWRSAVVDSTQNLSRGTFTVGQTEVPDNPTYYYIVEAITASGANDYVNWSQRTEDVLKSSGKTFTFTFYAKATAANKFVSLEGTQNFGSGGDASATGIGVKKFALTTSWAKYTHTITFPSVSGKTIGANNFFQILFWFDAGADYNARTDSLGNQSGVFWLSHIKLEEGTIATPFIRAGVTLQGELAECQRFYEKSYDTTVNPATASTAGLRYYKMALGAGEVAGDCFAVVKRAIPTVTLYDSNGNVDRVDGSAGAASSAYRGVSAFGYIAIAGSGLTKGNIYGYHWVANAEL